jgi:O-antigen ligase/polysaccharide polymerase Wzy-like membrane protein
VSGEALAAVLAAAGLGVLLTARPPAARRAAAAAWVAGTLWLAALLMRSAIDRARTLVESHPVTVVPAIVVAAVLLVAAAAVVRRWPWAFAVACVLAAPARIPVHFGSQDAKLLLPLYGVLAAGALATLYDIVRDREPAQPRGGAAALPLAVFAAFSAISLFWTVDLHQAAVTMLFFYLPFSFMAMRIGQLGWNPGGLRAAFLAQAGLAILFAAVALWQEATHHIFWNPSVEVSNAYRSFFRVNSLFWDASVYGRFMAVTLVLCAGVALYRGISLPLAAAMAFMFAGLYFTYSQSSYFALAAGAVALGAGLWPRRVTIALVAAGAVGLVAVVAVALRGNSAARVSDDRTHLIRLGWKVIKAHPAIGAGLSGLPKAAVAGTAHPFRVKGAASHTTPVTVAAELGPLGFALYVWVLGALTTAGARLRGAGAVPRVLVAALVAIFASSLFYDSFFEDPSMWLLAGFLAGASMAAAGTGGATAPA